MAERLVPTSEDRIDAAQIALSGVADGTDLDELRHRVERLNFANNTFLGEVLLIRAGVDPGLPDEVSWWRTDDLWFWALDALVVYLRVAAERTGEPISAVCEGVAKRHNVALPES